MNNQEERLLSLVEYGKEIAAEYKNATEDFRLPAALMVLLHVEGVLDRGRVLLSDADPSLISMLDVGMDEIRGSIVGLLKRVGAPEAKKLLEIASENLKLNFAAHLQE